MGYPKQTIAPYVEPLHLREVRNNLRIDDDVTEDDGKISRLIASARRQIEDQLGEQLVAATWTLYLDSFFDKSYVTYDGGYYGHVIELPRSPALSITSVIYTATDGVATTVDSADYELNNAFVPSRIAPAYGEVWPTPRAKMNAVAITYKSGYLRPYTAATSDTCTALGWTPTNGERVRLTNSGGTIPAGLAELTDYFIVSASGSTFSLSLTSGGAAVDITGTGAGTNFIGELPGHVRDYMLTLIAHEYEHRGDGKEDEPKALGRLAMLASHGEYP